MRALAGLLLAAAIVQAEPDPWLVADDLCARGKRDEARAVAIAAKDAKLRAFVAAYVPRAAARASFEKGSLASIDTAPVDVLSIRVLFARASAARANHQHRASAAAYRAAAGPAAKLGWTARVERALNESAEASFRGADWAAACAIWEPMLQAQPNARLLNNLGLAYAELGEHRKARAAHERALALARERGERETIARALEALGNAHRLLGDFDRAQDHLVRALRLHQEAGDRAGAARATTGLGLLAYSVGRLDQAAVHQRDALAAHRALGNRRSMARNFTSLGLIATAQGDVAGAVAHFEEARAISAAIGDRVGLGDAAFGLGHAHLSAGRFASALAAFERSLAIRRALGAQTAAGESIAATALVHESIGDHKRAIAQLKRALQVFEGAGNEPARGITLGNLGNNYLRLGAMKAAEQCLEEALAIAAKSGNRAIEVAMRGNLAAVCHATGRLDESLAHLERALPVAEQLDDPRMLVDTLNNIGEIHLMRGKHEEALRLRTRALELSAVLASAKTDAYLHWGLADVHLAMGNAVEALRAARRGVALLPDLVGRLADEQGSRARGRWNGLIEVGIRAALSMRSPTELSHFLESGRAGALLESLDNRTAIKNAALPADLRERERAATSAFRAARDEHDVALRSGTRKAIRAARAELDDARGALLDVETAIQRALKAAAEALYPKAASLKSIQACLEPSEALVLYAMLPRESCALVVTTGGARIVTLGPAAPIEAARRALGIDAPGKALATDALRSAIVTPLALPATVKRVLVSPHKGLAYVPFAALLARDVAYVPSGTTLRLLRSTRAARGNGVLALGDPDYSSRRGLAALPGSRDEAKAVGDVVLVGADANESALHDALARRPRWRAVHFACHGMVNPERPMLSALALTGGDLSTLEVFRMKCPADLVVLSACVTGKGRIYVAEGIVGFTRAFMFAGATRVVVSLWKVDDAATRVLMAKFYESWKAGGMDAAAALRKAQDDVRAQPKWRHPYYWAAWQLWGPA